MFDAQQLKRILILGSGPVGIEVARIAGDLGLTVEVFVGARQAGDVTTEGLLVIDQYRAMNIKVRVENDLEACDKGPYKTADQATLIFSFGSPYIIRKDLIERYDGRVVNSHGAPLPEWRGGGGFSWRILADDRRGNTCFHVVAPGIDKGDIVFQRPYSFPPEARYPREWMAIADREAGIAAREFIRHLYDGEPIERLVQEEMGATYFPRLHTPTQAFIDWSWSGSEVERFVLAFSHPYSGAKTFLGNSKISVFDCRPLVDANPGHDFFSGLIYRIYQDHAYVAVNEGSIVIPLESVRSETKMRVGDRLHTPQGVLDCAKAIRPVYTAAGLKGVED